MPWSPAVTGTGADVHVRVMRILAATIAAVTPSARQRGTYGYATVDTCRWQHCCTFVAVPANAKLGN